MHSNLFRKGSLLARLIAANLVSMQNDLRYPIGQFQRPDNFSLQQRSAFLERIAQTPANLAQAVGGLNSPQLDTPYREGGWTLRQVVHHVADSHMHSYIRTKFAVAEEHPAIKPYDEAIWADFDDAAAAPVEVSLTLLEQLHNRWVRWFRSLPEKAFQRTLLHPENGVMTLDLIVALYAWHGDHHTAHIRGLRHRMGW